jgi:polyferredoxin
VLGGFMREQVCIYMCPWPRIQTAMLDEKSLIVTYKDWRGEPRGSVKKAAKNPGLRRLHRLQHVRGGLPDRHRHPRRAADRLHHLRLCIDACDKVMARSAARAA